MTMMNLDEKLARIRTSRNNIRRYRRLLDTPLTDLERDFVERRLTEEDGTLQKLHLQTFPLVLGARPKRPDPAPVSQNRAA
jgi:hypothetical protein